jgi:hypothetical protein
VSVATTIGARFPFARFALFAMTALLLSVPTNFLPSFLPRWVWALAPGAFSYSAPLSLAICITLGWAFGLFRKGTKPAVQIAAALVCVIVPIFQFIGFIMLICYIYGGDCM